MPVFTNPGQHNQTAPQSVNQQKTPRQKDDVYIPAWRSSKAPQGIPEVPAWMDFTPGYGQQPPTSGPGSVRRGRGTPDLGVQIQAPPDPLLNTPTSGPGSVRRGRGSIDLGIGIQKPEVQTYVANAPTYTAPTYYPKSPIPFKGPTTQIQQGPGSSQPEIPYRILDENGQWAYLQPDGSYLTATNTAGQTDMPYRNDFMAMPPLIPTPAWTEPADDGFSFGTNYGWGRRGGGGGGGGGGWSNTPYPQNKYTNLNSWNFGE